MTIDSFDTEVMNLRHFAVATCEKDTSRTITRERKKKLSESLTRRGKMSKNSGDESVVT